MKLKRLFDSNQSKEKLEILDTALKIANAGYFEWDMQKNIVTWDDNLYKLQGFSKSEYTPTAEKFNERYHPDDLEHVMSVFNHSVSTGKPFKIECRIKHNSGEYRWYKMHNRIKYDEKKRPLRMLGVIIDINDLKNREQQHMIEAQRLNYALEGSNDGLWDWDLITNEVFFSKRWKEMLGFKENEIRANLSEWEKRVHPDDIKQVEKDVNSHISGKTKRYRSIHRVKCKDGSYKWILDRGIITSYDANGKPLRMVGTHTDISEQKNLESELEKLSLVASNTTNSVIVTNSEGIVTWVNEGFTKMFGFTTKDILNKKPGHVLQGPDTKKADIESFSLKLKQQKPFTQTILNYRKDKSILIVRCDVVPVFNKKNMLESFISIETDVTKEKKYEAEISRFKLAVEAAYDHIILTDANGHIEYANDAAQKLTGFSFKEMQGNTPRLWGRQMPPEFYTTMWHTIKELKQPFVGEVINKRKSGEIYTAEAHISPILSSDGKVEYFLGVERDITKLKEVDIAKSEFVSLASHQLRTPLTSIRWNSETLLDKDIVEPSKEQMPYLNQIHESTIEMAGLITLLLNISRIELGSVAFEPKKVNIKNIVTKLTQELDNLIQTKKLSIKTNYHKNEIVKADPRFMQLVLQNLISNAVKYSKDKTSIEVSLNSVYSVNPESKTYSQKKIAHAKECLLISVKDHGIGIPKLEQEKIFTKMYRASNAQVQVSDGNGLGLYMAYEMTEDLNGSMWFESEVNKGTTFYVLLPLDKLAQKTDGSKMLDV